MKNKFHNVLFGISILPALLVMPAMAETVSGETEIKNQDLTHAYYYLNNSDDILLSGGTYTGNTSDSSAPSTPYNNRRFGVVAFVEGGSKLTVKNSVFENNSLLGDGGGALATGLGSALLDIENSQFIANHSQYDGGAIGNYGGLTIKNSLFKGNTAHYALGADGKYSQLVSDSNPIGGGAISLGAVSNTVVGSILQTTFEANKSGTVGGAIGTRLGRSADNSAAKLDIAATFISNEAYQDGGAIYNTFYANNGLGKGDGVTLSGVFSKNIAGRNGGAIFNDGAKDNRGNGNDGGIMTITDSSFTANTAAENGGAIYNTGTINFVGTNTFTGNKANNIANDIHNIKTVNIASGTTTLDGGITGTGTLTIANGATLNIGTASIEQATVTVNGTLIATVRDGNAQLNVSDTFDGTGSMKLALGGAGTYHVFGNKVFGGVDVSSSVYDLTWSEDGKDLTAVLKSAEDIAAENGVSAESAATLTNLSNSSSAKLNDLAVKIQETLANGTDEDKHAVEQATAALNPEKASVVQSVTTSVQNTVASLASNRMTMPAVGRNGGDFDLTSGGVWTQGLFNKSKMNDQFSAYTRGVAVGLDGTFDKTLIFGAGYAFNHSDVALNVRDTEIDSHTLFVYGQYKPNNWYVNTTLNYTLSDYEESSVVLGGVNVSADYTTTAFGAQIATGWELNHGVTPEFALRYLHVNGETYTNSHDVQNKLDGADYLTAMLGTKYNAAFNINNNLTLHPEVHYAVKYDLISDKSSSVVTMPGVAAYAVNGDRLSRIGGEFGLGLGMKYRGFDMSVNYDIDVRQDYTSQTGMLKFRYNF